MYNTVRRLLVLTILTVTMTAFGGEGGGGVTILPKPTTTRPPSSAAPSLNAQF